MNLQPTLLCNVQTSSSAENLSDRGRVVAQTFLSAGSGDFPVPSAPGDTVLESSLFHSDLLTFHEPKSPGARTALSASSEPPALDRADKTVRAPGGRFMESGVNPQAGKPALLDTVLSGVLFSLFAFSSFAAEEKLVITREVDPSKLIPISLSGFSGVVQDVLKYDLDVAGFTNVNPEVAQFNISGSNNGQVEGRVTDRISKATVLAVRYTDANLRTQAHAFADDVVLKLTGKPGIARTKIAFKGVRSDSGEIYIADYDGANAVPVTADRTVVAAPCWVPGRRMLYYHSYKSGFPDIYSHDLSTRERRVIAQHPGINISPAVSPDGTKVAMILSFRGSPDLYVCDAKGGSAKQLTKTKEDESSPCWSPDGSTLCYVSSESRLPALYLISANGDNKRKLRTSGAPRATEPDWSPDGKSIAFTTMFGNFAICVVSAQGGDATVLATGEDPSWAPNSRTIIFTRRAGGKSVLSLLDVPTKRVKDVGQNSGSNSQPSWAK